MPADIALGLVGEAEVAVRQCVQDDIPAGRGEREGALSGGDGLVIRAHEAEMLCQKARDLSKPTRVVEGRCEGLGLAQICQDTPKSLDGQSAEQGKPRSMACSRVSYCSGRCRGRSAPVEDPTASRCAERSRARCPARCHR